VQRRLLVSTLAVTVVAVLLLGLPLAFVLSRVREGQASQQLKRDATTLATGLQQRVDAGLPPDASEVGRSLSDRFVIITQRGGGKTVVGTLPPAHDTITARDSTRDSA
jgi:hypothetical protein